jgi:hypothetical protein
VIVAADHDDCVSGYHPSHREMTGDEVAHDVSGSADRGKQRGRPDAGPGVLVDSGLTPISTALAWFDQRRAAVFASPTALQVHADQRGGPRRWEF